MTTQQAPEWTGTERRGGRDRRSSSLAWTPERRSRERRRGGVGTRQPNPLAQLLEGVEPTRPEAFVPGSHAAEPAGQAGPAPAAIGKRLAPAHVPHDAIPSLAAVAGHPIHPMLVPLPIGSFVGALAADVAHAASGDPFFARAGRLLTGIGVVTGALAGAVGAVDFWGRREVRSHQAAWVHAGGNAAALGIGLLSLAARARRRGPLDDPARTQDSAALALSLLTGGILVVTGWLGGELSYRHRVGVTEREKDG